MPGNVISLQFPWPYSIRHTAVPQKPACLLKPRPECVSSPFYAALAVSAVMYMAISKRGRPVGADARDHATPAAETGAA